MQLAEMNRPQVEALSRDMPVVIPIGAFEQHGRHLPLFTDSLLVGEVARRAEALLADSVLLTPVLWLGNSAHHLDFQGTISPAPRTYLDLLNDLVENFLRHGFRRIVLLNGHGGNIVPGQQALFEVRQRHRGRTDLLLLLANYWALGGSSPREQLPELTQPSIQHACQWETSMVLAMRPDLVGPLQGIEPVDPGNPFLPASRGSVTQDISREGHVGDPASGHARIGETLLQTYVLDVTSLLRRVVAWDGRSWSG